MLVIVPGATHSIATLVEHTSSLQQIPRLHFAREQPAVDYCGESSQNVVAFPDPTQQRVA
jgi:hypothetical protein